MKRTLQVLSIFLLVLASIMTCVAAGRRPVTAVKNVMFLPLDERFTTRNIFLNLAKLTPFNILTPPVEMLPKLKQPANIEALHNWVDENIQYTDALVFSAEMYLYGGLIASRTSNDSTAVIASRLQKLVNLKKANPSLMLYLATVVMRIPSYNGDFEEPWYWASYGADIFHFSFFSDRFSQLKDESDKQRAHDYEVRIPPLVLSDWLWRRSRNFNITRQIVELESSSSSSSPLFQQIYITLDDNAEFGFNIREASFIQSLVSSLHLQSLFNIYPGADEVLLTALARLCVQQASDLNDEKEGGLIPVQVVYRNPLTKHYIPNYEGQPLNASVASQLRGAGAYITQENNSKNNSPPRIILLVNNFDEEHQREAPNLPQPRASFDIFTPFIQKYKNINEVTLAFADVRFSNGGDLQLVNEYMPIQKLNINKVCYAGWNTNGNTLGTVIANAIVLNVFKSRSGSIKSRRLIVEEENVKFQALRLLEDLQYQVIVRSSLNEYVNGIANGVGDSTSNLSNDLQFYEEYVVKGLKSYYNKVMRRDYYPSFEEYKVENLYFPWNRTFEIGFTVK